MRLRFPTLSIATIFFSIMLGLTVVGGSAVSIWRGHATFRLEQQNLLRQDALLAHALSQGVGIFLGSAERAVSTLAGEAGALSAMDPVALQPIVERFARKNNQAFISMYVIDPNGIEIADYFPGGASETERLAGIGVNLSDRPYFKNVLAARKPVVSDAVIGRSTKRPVVVVAAPIFGTNGDLVGVAAGSLALRAIEALGEQTGDGEIIPVVIDAAGKVVAHPDPAIAEALHDATNIPPAKHARAGETGVVTDYIGVNGMRLSAAYEPVKGYGWSTWVDRDTSRFSVLVRTIIRDTLLSLLLLLVVAGVAFKIVSRFLFLPLKRMTEQTKRIADGDLDSRIDIKGVLPSLEIMRLTERFNRMTTALKASIETKTQFLTVVSHAFRTPISALKWQTEIWTDGTHTLDDEQRDAWSDCAQLTKLLQVGFDNVFVALEITNKTVHIDRKPFDLAKAVKATATHMEPVAKAAGVTININVGPVPTINADENRIAKCLEAIVTNAILYSSRGGTIDVSAGTRDGRAFVQVTDRGIGIAEEEKRRLFEPFFRGAEAKKKYTDGAGLGLYIADAFIRLHGGTLRIESQKGVGTTVTVTLPA